MGDWSNLPKDLLDQIAKKLISETDILRFRSVCSSWRSSVLYPPLHRLPNRIPINPKNATNGLPDSGFFYLSKRLIFRLGLPENHRRDTETSSNCDGWLIKIEQDVPEMFHLLNPLSESPIHPLPSTFPKILDLINFRVSELGQEYVLRYTDRRPIGYSGDVYMEKVAFSSNSLCSSDIDFVIMTIHVSGKLALFRSSESTWTIIEDLPSPYDDVIHYNGQFYAVDTNGRTVVVGLSLTVTEIASPIFGGDKKCLVESEGELHLVDRYLSIGPDDDPGYFDYDDGVYVLNDDSYIMDTTVRFKVFKLDQVGHNWVEVKNLGDRVLFLGDNCSFSVSVGDLSGCKGNCIYFTDRYFHQRWEEEDAFKCHYIGVFSLEDGSIGPLSSYPDYSRLFWPPPSWVMSTAF